MSPAEFTESLAEMVDNRRLEITQAKRVVSYLSGNSPLENTACLMAIPILYAHWEGFVKEAIQLYIEYVEAQGLPPARANPVLFTFMMRKKIRSLLSQQTIERMTDFSKWILKNAESPVTFDDKKVDTKSNLSFESLKEICSSIDIDVGSIQGHKKKIDALVHQGNNVAHTGRSQKVSVDEIGERADLVLSLITSFEAILAQCVHDESYVNKARASSC
jgi:hypothetical protein